MDKNELKNYVKENSSLIYEYLNTVILKDIGVMSEGFFIRLIKDFFNKENICTKNIEPNTFGYYLIVETLGDAKQAFPFFRKDTLLLDGIFSKAKVYFNHVKFSIENDKFNISLIQTKAGVSTLEVELIKYSKEFPMDNLSLEEFISKNTNITHQNLKKEIENIL